MANRNKIEKIMNDQRLLPTTLPNSLHEVAKYVSEREQITIHDTVSKALLTGLKTIIRNLKNKS